MALPPGTRIGPYEVVTMLGTGGMGEVYRATDRRLGRDVAVKVLPEAKHASPDRAALSLATTPSALSVNGLHTADRTANPGRWRR